MPTFRPSPSMESEKVPTEKEILVGYFGQVLNVIKWILGLTCFLSGLVLICQFILFLMNVSVVLGFAFMIVIILVVGYINYRFNHLSKREY